MKDYAGKITYRGTEYKVVFNLNVMEAIQEKYGSLEEWANLTDNAKEPHAKAVIFGFTQMINEGIDIDNEENGTDIKPLKLKQVGRIMTEIGLEEATKALNQTVIESTKSTEKNV